MISTLMPLITAATLALATAGATATVLLDDSFDTENGGNGAAEYSGFANWTVANVDLLAPGYFYSLCGAAGGGSPCVDMEGSGNGTMTTRTAYDFAAGGASLQFDLAGDQRGRGSNGLVASLVSIYGEVLYTESFYLGADDPFTTISRDIGIAADVRAFLRFESIGPADSMGLLLDNVLLLGDLGAPGDGGGGGPMPSPVPEPSLPLMFTAGLAGLGLVRRRRASQR